MAIDRREILAGFGLAGGGLLAGSAAASASPRQRLNLDDPKVALDSYVKLRGSIADETSFQVYDGDIFLVADGKLGIPLCGFRGIQKSQWRRDGQGGYTNRDYDVGFYVDYRTREIMHEWANPVTGRTVEVFHYRSGPSGGHFRLDRPAGDVYGGLDGHWTVAGDQVWYTSATWAEWPNAMKPADWPLASSGETARVSMSLTFIGKTADLLDPHVTMAPTQQIWTDVLGWMAWMEMGQRPGANMWRMVGVKGIAPGAIDPALVAAVERVWPGYVHADTGWTVPTAGQPDYMRLKRGLPLTR